MVTSALPELMLKIRKAGVPPAVLLCTVKRFAPVPLMDTLSVIRSSPEVSVMV